MEWGTWVDECLGGRWDVTIYFVFIMSFCCAIPENITEGQKYKNTHNGLLKV